MSSSRKCWVAVNKDGFISMFTDVPVRNNNTGKWEGTYYLDSFIYGIVKDMITKVNMKWDNEPEFFEFGPKINKE